MAAGLLRRDPGFHGMLRERAAAAIRCGAGPRHGRDALRGLPLGGAARRRRAVAARGPRLTGAVPHLRFRRRGSGMATSIGWARARWAPVLFIGLLGLFGLACST